jgi:hypothetical protein
MDNSHEPTPEICCAGDAITSSGVNLIDTEVISDRYLNRVIGTCCADDNGRFLVSRPVNVLMPRYAPYDWPTTSEIEPVLAGQDAGLIAKGHEPIAASVNTGCSTQVSIGEGR